MIKLSILSDTHFGFAENNEKIQNDSFEIFDEIYNKCKDSDLIIIAGDVFDKRNPKISIIEKAVEKLRKFKNENLKLIETNKKIELLKTKIITVIGNHERPLINEKSVLDLLEQVDIVLNLNKDYVVFEKDNEKIAIFGMGNVSESLAKEHLYSWNPQPKEDCFNVLVLHQNISPYTFEFSDFSLDINNLPRNFNLIINGHYHKKIIEDFGNFKLIMPGSTIVTQFREDEANSEKFIIDVYIENGRIVKIEEVTLKTARNFFYLKFNGFNKELILNSISKILSKEFVKQPIIKIEIVGDEKLLNEDLNFIEKNFERKAIIEIKKTIEREVSYSETKEEISKENISIFDYLINNIKEKLKGLEKEIPMSLENFIREMENEDNIDKVYNIFLNKQKTLK